MKQILVPVALLVLGGAALAKLPPPDDAAKAKAAEAAAKNAWQAKVDGYKLCKVQDRIAAAYAKSAGQQAPKVPAQAGPTVQAAPPPAKAASAAGTPPQGAATAGPGGTPVTSSSPPSPCQEPGPFAYNPPEQKPLETSGAHSPTGTAAGPPSVKQDSATMNPSKKP